MGLDPAFYPSFWTLIALLAAIWAFRRASAVKTELAALRAQIEKFAAPAAPPVAPAGAAAPVPDSDAAPSYPGRVWSGSGSAEEISRESPVQAEAVVPPATAPMPARDIERRLASRWLVWLGGLAIAIGGVLFVKHAVDNGLLSPGLRCLVGLAAGLALIGAGEWLRRRPLQRAAAALEPDYVPPALTAAGLLIAFASIYAAHAWYGLIGPTTAFAGFAAIALAAFVLALAQGPLIAGLGLIGAYGTPALIPSADPSAGTFFPYLLIVLAACIAILRRRPWEWLGMLALAGNLGWTLLWLNSGIFEPADQLPIGLFLSASATIALFCLEWRGILADEAGSLVHLAGSTPAFRIATAGMAAGGFGLCALVHASGHSNVALWMLLAGLAGAFALAWSSRGFARLARVAGATVFITLMVWRDAAFFMPAMDEQGVWSSVLGPGAGRFLAWMLSFGTLLTIAGLAGLRLRPEPIAWASLASAAPVLFVVGAWARVADALPEAQWAMVAGAAAAGLAAMVWLMRRRLTEADMEPALGLLVVGAAILALFALDRLLDGVWLTLAVAMIVPLLALIGRNLKLSVFGPLAAGLACLAALRLFLARELIEERRDLPLGLHWMLYGYGLPAVAFWQSSRWMREAFARSAMTLEGVALALAIALVSLELRVLIAGGIGDDEPGLLEAAAHVMAWLGAVYGLMHRLTAAPSPLHRWAARLLLTLSCAALVLLNLSALNPVVTEEPLPGNALFNALLLAYLAPAILLGLIAWKLEAIGWRRLLPAVGSLALVLVLAYVTLETKRLFQGRLMAMEWLSQPESYAYSAVWLATALGLLIAGIRFASPPVRYGGLAIIALSVAKVFLVDLSDLEGLYRIASLAGLGLCLVGIGYLYTRFLHQPSITSLPR